MHLIGICLVAITLIAMHCLTTLLQINGHIPPTRIYIIISQLIQLQLQDIPLYLNICAYAWLCYRGIRIKTVRINSQLFAKANFSYQLDDIQLAVPYAVLHADSNQQWLSCCSYIYIYIREAKCIQQLYTHLYITNNHYIIYSQLASHVYNV